MPQICPSSSHQLAAAAVAFRQARQKFPKKPKNCACSGDSNRTTPQTYPALGFKNIVNDEVSAVNHLTIESFGCNVQRRRNQSRYPSVLSSRTASWSNDCHKNDKREIIRDPKTISKDKSTCASCGKKRQNSSDVLEAKDSNKTTIKLMNKTKERISDQGSSPETESKSTHSSSGQRKRRHVKHRRAYNRPESIRRTSSRSPKIQARDSHICQLHRNQIPEQVCCRESPTAKDFPTKLQTWEQRTQPGSCRRRNNGTKRESMLSQGEMSQRKNFPKDETGCRSNYCQNEKRKTCVEKKSLQTASDADVCLRPSLIKAAQRKMDIGVRNCGRNYKNYGKVDRPDVKSVWEDNLNVLRHKDSMSILMERFKSNDKHQTLKLHNIYQLNSVLGSKTSCGDGETLESEKNHLTTESLTNHSLDEVESIETNFPARKSYSGVNPVKKLARVANQGLRDNENRLKSLRNRLNKSGMCCSPKGTPWRRAF